MASTLSCKLPGIEDLFISIIRGRFQSFCWLLIWERLGATVMGAFFSNSAFGKALGDGSMALPDPSLLPETTA